MKSASPKPCRRSRRRSGTPSCWRGSSEADRGVGAPPAVAGTSKTIGIAKGKGQCYPFLPCMLSRPASKSFRTPSEYDRSFCAAHFLISSRSCAGTRAPRMGIIPVGGRPLPLFIFCVTVFDFFIGKCLSALFPPRGRERPPGQRLQRQPRGLSTRLIRVRNQPNGIRN
jgi:hypothetical protein